MSTLPIRERVIETSRRKYGRPRMEVEAEIARQMGWETPVRQNKEQGVAQGAENKATSEIRNRLSAVGVTAERADSLLQQFDLTHIQQQLDWLPYRHARNQAAFLVAAIEGDYERPLMLNNQVLKSRESAKP